MTRVVHVIGNGDHSQLYKLRPRKGLKLTCNLPPFEVPDYFATTIVDFKMMRAIQSGQLQVPFPWIIGYRPKMWMDKNPGFYMKVANGVKTIYTELPDYCPNYTDFSCGHFAAHYAANKLKADMIHLYGFDSIFDFNLRSCSDFYMWSDRENMNNNRLIENWRPVWPGMFKEFPNCKFVFHHIHDNIKIPISDNVTIETYDVKETKKIYDPKSGKEIPYEQRPKK